MNIEKSQSTTIIDTKEKNQHSLEELLIIETIKNIENPFTTLSVSDVSKDLHIGINQAYDLFKQKDFPSICIGKRKTVTLAAYLLWKMNKKGV